MINLVVYGQVGQFNIKYGTHVNGTIILNYPDFNCRRPGKVCNRCNKGHSKHLEFICVSGHCVCIYVKQFEWENKNYSPDFSFLGSSGYLRCLALSSACVAVGAGPLAFVYSAIRQQVSVCCSYF